jgi:hypothetical protein
VRRRVLCVAALLCLAAPTGALAASGSAVIRDCTANGKITQHHSQRELRDALANLPADIEEYSNCRQLIRQALLGSGRGGGGSGSGGSSGGGATVQAPPSPVEQRALRQAVKHGVVPVHIGSETLTPGASPFGRRGFTNSLPTPLTLLLAALAAACLVGVSLGLRRAVRGFVLARRAH